MWIHILFSINIHGDFETKTNVVIFWCFPFHCITSPIIIVGITALHPDNNNKLKNVIIIPIIKTSRLTNGATNVAISINNIL